MKRSILPALLLSVVVSTQAFGEVRTYLLGDEDGYIYEGPASEDNVYVDPVWQTELSEFTSWTEVDFDEAMAGSSMVPFTFEFDLLGDEVVTEAELEFRLAPRGFGGGPLETDRIYFDSVELSYLLIGDLGWDGTDSVLTLDLAEVGVVQQDDLRQLLQDGQLNCMVEDDSKIDYAKLTVVVVPEPATLGMLAFGLLGVLRQR